jgi:hypothetical protein
MVLLEARNKQQEEETHSQKGDIKKTVKLVAVAYVVGDQQ